MVMNVRCGTWVSATELNKAEVPNEKVRVQSSRWQEEQGNSPSPLSVGGGPASKEESAPNTTPVSGLSLSHHGSLREGSGGGRAEGSNEP